MLGSPRAGVCEFGHSYRVWQYPSVDKEAQAIRYTIGGVPPDVDRAFREKANLRKQSLSQVILDELTMSALGGQRRADFSAVVGKRTPDPEFDEILAAQRQIDWDKWK